MTTTARQGSATAGIPVTGRRRSLPLQSPRQRSSTHPALLEVIENRKSGLSVNWIIGCPLDCGYCVRHLFDNYAMKTPHAVLSEGDTLARLIEHRYFEPHVTPIQLLNRATDPMLPGVKPHLFEMLRLLDERGLTNHVLVITRWRVEPQDCTVLNSLRHIKVTLLVTYSGISDDRIEPVDSRIAVASLRSSFAHAERYRVVLYWRPIVPGLNDSDADLERAMALTRHAHATVFTGLFYKGQIRAYYRDNALPEPYETTARRKVFPRDLERRILAAAAKRSGGSPLFRKTSCAVAFAHGTADYNGHVGIRELCDICPATQLRRCRTARRRPPLLKVSMVADDLGGKLIGVNDRAIVVSGLDEERRYQLQHHFGYQVHDVTKPHHPHRHGRADIGWPTLTVVTS